MCQICERYLRHVTLSLSLGNTEDGAGSRLRCGLTEKVARKGRDGEGGASRHYLVPNVTKHQTFRCKSSLATMWCWNAHSRLSMSTRLCASPSPVSLRMVRAHQQQQQLQLAPTDSHHDSIQASGRSPSVTMSFMSCHGLSSEHCKPRCPPSQLLVAMGCLSHVASTERACCGRYFQLRQCDA